MWLLNTSRAELEFFPAPESVPGGYAILSHVWGKDEQTFQDLQAIRSRCAKKGTNPRDRVCDKIREFCILAECCGHEWGWADMCCIDKTSSTELSEAITSMYQYYSLAEDCYVYLCDVATASEDDLRAPESDFRKSRWHKRGWTLQELIAPPFVVFLSNTWEPLGAKADLADVLEEITRVPTAVLKLDHQPSTYCVAARMSWAADRETTRPEDEAYCLMGIFGIFMPPLYGEGRNAFLRLQEEIMRQVDDPSIFAWGPIDPFNASSVENVLRTHRGISSEDVTLFARSPSDFLDGYRIRRRTERPRSQKNLLEELKIRKAPVDLSRLPTFSITPYGVMAHLPVFTSTKKNLLVALLLGINVEASGGTTRNIGLLLRAVESPDHSRQLYVPSSFLLLHTHLIVLEGDLQHMAERTKTTLEWRTIYVVHGTPSTTDTPGLQMVSQSLYTPFHIPKSEITRIQQWQGVASYSLHPPNPTEASWHRHVALSIVLSYKVIPVSRAVVYLGLCSKTPPGHPQHWARITEYRLLEAGELERVVEHVCAEHHVDKRPRQTHPLAIYNLTVLPTVWLCLKLSFKPHPLSLTPCRKVYINFAHEETV